ncbi:MAG: PSD1 and planctomycete cytochrome C domain-containing protein [Pirellulales bacterium]
MASNSQESRTPVDDHHRRPISLWSVTRPTPGPRRPGAIFLTAILTLALGQHLPANESGTEFFEQRVRPVLVEHCYSCHSAASRPLRGGLRLDVKAGWERGGESGMPAIVPGQPADSPLIQAVRHSDGFSAMPPRRPPLPPAVIADLERWVREGAPDPRTADPLPSSAETDWETTYRTRREWWSWQPVPTVAVPGSARPEWERNPVDRFIAARLHERGLQPAGEAGRWTLARRLSFALTGLPPDPAAAALFVEDPSPDAYDGYVARLLSSPHFGERWARHWMDVVHYADTHGYEWDAPAKHAWRYRDYLVRAFNDDVPIQQLILEQLAGDLLEPRIDPRTGWNEARIGPMALRLGERRHGDSSQVEGVTQEAIANLIDTLGKGFLGTTLACAQCHDHKLDAVSQRDYYALAGVFMSTRWGVASLDTHDPNTDVLAELAQHKENIRQELARLWRSARSRIVSKLGEIPADEKPGAFPTTLIALWKRTRAQPLSRAEFQQERARRQSANATHLQLLADFTRPEPPAGWRWDGFGMAHGWAPDGEVIVAHSGDQVVQQIVPAGRWSHRWSERLAGAIRSPLFPPDSTQTFSVGYAGGRHAAQSVIIDQAFHSERMGFLNQPTFGWLTLKAGGFDSLEGSIDKARRRVYLELATKDLNNYFPPRTGYGGLPESEIADPRSWFGVTRVYAHPPGNPPLDELNRFAPLFAEDPAPGTHPADALADLLLAAVDRWAQGSAGPDDALLLDEAVRAGLLPNERTATAALTEAVAAYRATEPRLIPDQTIGTAADWQEGRNERIGIRGSYTELGDEVPRGGPRFLGDAARPASTTATGRLELARCIADPANPLTARVFVNRVWLQLFGEGLVRTPDDFGHLGEPPVHPELLDYLAARFVREGWSLKRLITLLVDSATWRQTSRVDPRAWEVDPENRWWHHRPWRRLEAEAIRDSLLAASGRLDTALGGPPIDPYRTAQDPAKRLFSGPLDGRGRRSLYTKMTLMEPPRLLAIFNQPLPKLTVGKRDITQVPDQALALLNDPLVIELARVWGTVVVRDGAATVEERAGAMFTTACSRPPQSAETTRLADLARRSAALRGVDSTHLMTSPAVWQDVAHALFNLQEFVHVP